MLSINVSRLLTRRPSCVSAFRTATSEYITTPPKAPANATPPLTKMKILRNNPFPPFMRGNGITFRYYFNNRLNDGLIAGVGFGTGFCTIMVIDFIVTFPDISVTLTVIVLRPFGSFVVSI